MILGATPSASQTAFSRTFSSSTIAPLPPLRRTRSGIRTALVSRARPRSTAATMSAPVRDRSKPAGIVRRRPSASALRGAADAMSMTASSFRTRPRGTLRVCASLSRQAATSISTAISRGLRIRPERRRHAWAGSAR